MKKKQTKKPEKVDIGVMNATPTSFYSKNPCMIAFSYVRFEVTGHVRACCIAKHAIGDLSHANWRQVWRSEAYSAFRRKMMRIHKEKFHLKDPEYFFCQQCSHMGTNVKMNDARDGKKG